MTLEVIYYETFHRCIVNATDSALLVHIYMCFYNSLFPLFTLRPLIPIYHQITNKLKTKRFIAQFVFFVNIIFLTPNIFLNAKGRDHYHIKIVLWKLYCSTLPLPSLTIKNRCISQKRTWTFIINFKLVQDLSWSNVTLNSLTEMLWDDMSTMFYRMK